MAKAQGLSLNPGKISGLCGRLMCCLSYENDYYVEVGKKMPKVGSDVGTPEGKATVASLDMLRLQVKVKISDGNGGWIFKDYPASELRYKRCEGQAEDVDNGDEE